MTECTQALIEFFNRELPKLKESYAWKIPNISGFEKSGQTDYDSNVAMKRFLNRQWHNSNGKQKLKICQLIISDWGGVRGNKEATLEEYVRRVLQGDLATPITGVASYSKLYSIVYPQKFAIYDARVAACLVAVQYLAGVSQGLGFNYVSGRNNVIGHQEKRIGFVYEAEFRTKSLAAKGWQRIKRDDTYPV